VSGIIRSHDIAGRNPDIMTGIAKQGTTQIVDPGVVVGALMEIASHRKGVLEGTYLDAAEKKLKGGVTKAVALQAALECGAGHVVAEIAGGSKGALGGKGAGRRRAPELLGKHLSSLGIDQMIVAERTNSLPINERLTLGILGIDRYDLPIPLRNLAMGDIFEINVVVVTQSKAGSVVAAQTKSRDHLAGALVAALLIGEVATWRVDGTQGPSISKVPGQFQGVEGRTDGSIARFEVLPVLPELPLMTGLAIKGRLKGLKATGGSGGSDPGDLLTPDLGRCDEQRNSH
jgi:hypothetical protein